jgi:uncharacterized ParB-like nuclease family protein
MICSMPQQVIRIRIANIAPWRCANPKAARRYAAMLRAGQRLPPIAVIRQPGQYQYRLFDGFHRARAATLVGRKVIDAVVIANNPPRRAKAEPVPP